MDPLDRLVDRLFDYAGMFPPASLAFEQALEQAARHEGQLHRAHLIDADMVVQTDHLPQLTNGALDATGWRPGQTCTLALVGVPLQHAAETVEAVATFNEAFEQSAVVRRITSLEITTSGPLGRDRPNMREALVELQKQTPAATRLFLEPRWDPTHWESSKTELFGLLEQVPQVGLKVRCAGETAITHETMAEVLEQANRLGMPLKATQGLHHPILEERWDNSWGFLNLVAALRFLGATADDFSRSQTLKLLAETDPKAYSFENGLRWREHELDSKALAQAIQAVPLAIGSCNIKEADEDLKRLFG